MAIQWQWKDKVGELTYNGSTVNLYEGNCMLIALHEWDEGNEHRYNLSWFFDDKIHAKRCLGLTKGCFDMFEGNVEKLVLYKDKCHNWKDIIDLFMKSQKNCVITLQPTERKEEA